MGDGSSVTTPQDRRLGLSFLPVPAAAGHGGTSVFSRPGRSHGGGDGPGEPRTPTLLEQVRGVMRARHSSLRTEEASVRWIRRFIVFHGTRHPCEMGAQEVQQFLTHLAVEDHVAASTQRQALSAMLFLYRQVLKQDIGWIDEVVRAKPPQRIPVVLTQDEVAGVLRHVSGTTGIMATLLYGAGLRLMECMRLRIKDLDSASNHMVVHDGTGHKDRVTRLPRTIKAPFQRHLKDVKTRPARDLQAGAGHVYLPDALERTYPHGSREWAWQYVFPAASSRGTHGRASSGGITCTNWCCSGRCRPLSERRRSPRRRVVIHCGTRLRRISSRRGTTFERCRHDSGTQMSGRP